MDLWEENENFLFAAAKKFKEEEDLRKIKEAEEEEAAIRKMNAGIAGISFSDIATDLVEKVPALQVLYTEKTKKALNEKEESAKQALVDAIAQASAEWDAEQVDSVTFFAEYAKTQDVLAHLADEKKLEYICNLFVNYFMKENHTSQADVYECYLNILQTLTSRELEVLKSMDSFANEADIFYADVFAALKAEVMNKWELSQDQFAGMMKNIARYGFCKEVPAQYWEYEGVAYRVTDYFQHFLMYITER